MKGFTLSPKEINQLKSQHKAEKERRVADKIKAVVLLGSGWSCQSVSEALLLDEETLRNYVKRYTLGGLKELVKKNYKGSVARLSQEQQSALKSHLSEFTYPTISSIIEYVKRQYGVVYQATRMREVLTLLGFVYKKPKVVPGQSDPVETLKFLQQYEALRRAKKPLYFMDGVHPQHNSRPSQGWILKGEDKALLSNTGRQRININGAVNIDSYQLITRVDETINAQSSIALFQKILKQHKSDKEVYIICDNAGYYRSKLVTTFLEKEKKLKLVFLPAYSPFLNLIERVWKYFNRKVLYNQYYSAFRDFKAACLDFFRRSHKRAFKKILVEKFHFVGKNLEILKPISQPC